MLGFLTKPVESAISGFWSGFWAPARALGMILTGPHLLSLVAIPLAVNIGLYILFFHYGSDYMSSLVAQVTAHLAGSLPAFLVSISSFALKLLSWLLLALVAMLTFTFVGGLISAPFNDALSKAALRRHTKGANHSHVKHDLKTVLWLECKRMVILLAGAILALVVGLIPFLQLVALVLGAFLVSFEYFGYPISHQSASLRPVFVFTLRHPAVSLGFGSFLLLLMALPFASLVYIPLAVVGGTILHADHDTSRT